MDVILLKLFLAFICIICCSGHVLIVPAIGRTADFGDIYDARTNRFTKDSIFTRHLNPSFISTRENPNTKYDFSSAKSGSEKLDAFEIGGELKLQIMCGAVDVGGSAKYLTDNKNIHQYIVSTYILKSKTAKETFNWKNVELRNITDFEQIHSEGTHVVVEIQYGGNGIVTLSQKIGENSNRKNIQGKLDAMVKGFSFIGGGDISGSIGGSYNTSSKETSEDISIKVEADVKFEPD